MRIKILIITALLAAMLTVGSASAEVIKLTQTNIAGDPSGYEVTVITDESGKTMSVKLTGFPEGCQLGENPGIDKLYYNLNIPQYGIDSVSGNNKDWEFNSGTTTADGFGNFESYRSQSIRGAETGGITSPLIFTLNDMKTIDPNSDGHRVAVHMRFGSCNNVGSAFITDRKEVSAPEFPSLALPIAAVMVLIFFLHYRKRNL